ncbi:MAG: AraC family transcriptional regulator [Ferruginibacter sp.]
MELIYTLFALLTGSLFLLSIFSLLNITRGNVEASRWLGIFYCFLACAFLQQFMEISHLVKLHPAFVHLLELTRFALAPSLYLAICCFVYPHNKLWKSLLHFIPAALFLIYSAFYIIPRFFLPSEFRSSDLPEVLVFILKYFARFQAIVYGVLSYLTLKRHRKNISQINSSVENIDLLWMKNLLAGALCLLGVWLVSKYNNTTYQLTPIAYLAGIFYMGYFSLQQKVIYPFQPAVLMDINNMLHEKKSYERLTIDQVTILQRRLTEIMESEKLYLDPALTLPGLSKELGINTHDLSYVLNHGFKKTFYQYINQMRVEEAKLLLLSDKLKKLDMMGIACHAGFNSKTTFNTTFKKLTGQSPTEFVKLKNTL